MDGTRGGTGVLADSLSVRYVPKEKLIELYKNCWVDWCKDPPEWFDDDFKALIRKVDFFIVKFYWPPSAKSDWANLFRKI